MNKTKLAICSPLFLFAILQIGCSVGFVSVGMNPAKDHHAVEVLFPWSSPAWSGEGTSPTAPGILHGVSTEVACRYAIATWLDSRFENVRVLRTKERAVETRCDMVYDLQVSAKTNVTVYLNVPNWRDLPARGQWRFVADSGSRRSGELSWSTRNDTAPYGWEDPVAGRSGQLVLQYETEIGAAPILCGAQKSNLVPPALSGALLFGRLSNGKMHGVWHGTNTAGECHMLSYRQGVLIDAQLKP